jgi:hypothetical protein
MKQIEPVQIWTNGVLKTAEFLDAKGINVTLGVLAGFWWGLFTKVVDAEGNESAGECISSGNLDMVGDDYQSWNQDTFAWDWVAEQLNLTIIA